MSSSKAKGLISYFLSFHHFAHVIVLPCLAVTRVRTPPITESLFLTTPTNTTHSIQSLATTLVADTTLLRFFTVHKYSSLYKFRIGATGFLFGFLNPEDGTDSLPRNVDKKLPLLAV